MEAELSRLAEGGVAAGGAAATTAAAGLRHVAAVLAHWDGVAPSSSKAQRGRGTAAAATAPRRLVRPPPVQIAMFSATVPPGVEELALSVLHEPLRYVRQRRRVLEVPVPLARVPSPSAPPPHAGSRLAPRAARPQQWRSASCSWAARTASCWRCGRWRPKVSSSPCSCLCSQRTGRCSCTRRCDWRAGTSTCCTPTGRRKR